MDFATARYNMVEQQIRPWDVLDFDLLDVLSDIPRERFVLPEEREIAYSDSTLALANGGRMLEPKMAARLIQALELKPEDTVLEIGTGSGYATAIMAKLAGKAVTVDSDPDQQAKARFILGDLDYTNITFVTGDGCAPAHDNAHYSAIYVGGSLPTLPQSLTDKLADGGRMAVIVGNAPVMQAMLVVRKGDTLEKTPLFETVAPALHSAAVPGISAFRF